MEKGWAKESEIQRNNKEGFWEGEKGISGLTLQRLKGKKRKKENMKSIFPNPFNSTIISSCLFNHFWYNARHGDPKVSSNCIWFLAATTQTLHDLHSTHRLRLRTVHPLHFVINELSPLLEFHYPVPSHFINWASLTQETDTEKAGKNKKQWLWTGRGRESDWERAGYGLCPVECSPCFSLP